MDPVNFLEGVKERVKDEGWLVVGVPGEGVDHTLSYTVGLTDKGLPELLTYGLPVQTGQVILNHLAQLAIVNGRFENGQRVTEVANMPVVLLDCVLPAPANVAHQIYDGTEVQQMIFPDERGLFPWEEGFRMEPEAPILGVLP